MIGTMLVGTFSRDRTVGESPETIHKISPGRELLKSVNNSAASVIGAK
jgi:hypothetical protein